MDEKWDRCWCCRSILDTKNMCPVCDYPGMMSPPHVCLRSGNFFTDERGTEPEFPPLEKDHENPDNR